MTDPACPVSSLPRNLYDRTQGMDHVVACVDGHFSAVMTKVASIGPSGVDPVELIPDEARELAAALS